MTTTKNKHFFCYSVNLFNFLKREKNQSSILVAKHLKTDNVFWLFERTPEFEEALAEWTENGKNIKK